MATSSVSPVDSVRSGLLFAWSAYSRIAAKKHNLPMPSQAEAEQLSNEQLELQVMLMKDLAHLPPG